MVDNAKCFLLISPDGDFILKYRAKKPKLCQEWLARLNAITKEADQASINLICFDRLDESDSSRDVSSL